MFGRMQGGLDSCFGQEFEIPEKDSYPLRYESFHGLQKLRGFHENARVRKKCAGSEKMRGSATQAVLLFRGNVVR